MSFDLSKTFIHMEDNEDGTMTITGHLKEGALNAGLSDEDTLTVVVPSTITEMMRSVTEAFGSEENVMRLYDGSVIIPNEPPTD